MLRGSRLWSQKEGANGKIYWRCWWWSKPDFFFNTLFRILLLLLFACVYWCLSEGYMGLRTHTWRNARIPIVIRFVCVFFFFVFVSVCAAFTSIHNKNLKAKCNLIDKRKSMCSVSVTGCNLNGKKIHLGMGPEREKDHLVLVDCV